MYSNPILNTTIASSANLMIHIWSIFLSSFQIVPTSRHMSCCSHCAKERVHLLLEEKKTCFCGGLGGMLSACEISVYSALMTIFICFYESNLEFFVQKILCCAQIVADFPLPGKRGIQE